MRACACVCVYVRLCARVCVCVCAYSYVCMYVCMYVCIYDFGVCARYIYIYMYMYIYMHMIMRAVKLQGNRSVTGVLRGFDPFMNLVLEGSEEIVAGTQVCTIGV